MPGPRRIPNHLKLAAGKPSHHKFNPGPDFAPGTTDPPAHLNGVALETWNSLVAELNRLNVWRECHRLPMEGLCLAYQKARDADADLAVNGMTVRGLHSELPRPQVAISRQAWDATVRYCSEFGFTLASASKVVVNQKPGQMLKDMLG
jgi:P27 family predicted phage terminase small subunit